MSDPSTDYAARIKAGLVDCNVYAESADCPCCDAQDALASLEAELAEARASRRRVPGEEGGPGKEETYWLRAKLAAAVTHLRDIEDYYRTRGGTRDSFNQVRADRARGIYEQITADFIEGRINVPTLKERAEQAEAEAEKWKKLCDDLIVSADEYMQGKWRAEAALRDVKVAIDRYLDERDEMYLMDAKRLAAATGEAETERDEMVCDRCGRRHDVVWFAPSDLWNDVMREGDRGNPDEFSFCCPTCFMQLADEREVGVGMWVVAADPGGGPYPTMVSLFGEAETDKTGIECDGGPYCKAERHLHGCLSDRPSVSASEPWLNALDRAARYYREALKHILEECGNDKPRISHIAWTAERGIAAADYELSASEPGEAE